MQDLQFQICGDYSGRWEPGTPSVPSQLADGEHFFLARWRAGDAELGWFGIYHPALADIKEELPKLAAKISRDASSPARWDNLKYLSHHIPGWGLYYAHPDYIRLWRDPFGILPIVLSFRDRGVQWATRPKFLPTPPTKVRQSRVDIFLRGRNDSARDDFWQDVYRLRSGETLLCQTRQRKSFQTWWPVSLQEVSHEEDRPERVEQLLSASLDRATDRGATAVSLSGGVDSTLLAALMTERGHNITAFSMIAPKAPDFNEQDIVAITTEKLNINVEFFDVDQQLEWANPHIHHLLPDFGPAILPEAAYVVPFLMQMKKYLNRGGTPVYVSGLGADHLFSCTRGDYLRHKVFEDKQWSLIKDYQNPKAALRHAFHRFGIPTPARDTQPKHAAPWSIYKHKSSSLRLAEPIRTQEWRRCREFQFQSWFWEGVCRLEERYRRTTSILQLHPFLDPVLAEFAFSLPPSYLRTYDTNKIILRKLLLERVPRRVAMRPKCGMFNEIVWRGLIQYLEPAPEKLLSQQYLDEFSSKNSTALCATLVDLRQREAQIDNLNLVRFWGLLAVALWREQVCVKQ